MPVLAGCASCVNVGPNLGGFLATRCSSILCSQHGGIDSKVLGAQGQDLFQRDSVPAMAPVMPSGATHAEGPNTDRPGSATAYRKVLPLGKAGKQFHLVQSLQAMHAVCISSFAVCYSGSHPQARQVCLALSSRSARPRKRNPSTVWSEYVPLRFDSLSLSLSV